MRVLILHNRYRYAGGEDRAVDSEAQALRDHGVEVLEPHFDNGTTGPFPILGAIGLAADSAWSRKSHEQVRTLCANFRPDIVHVHNFWMRISPSVHSAAREYGAATVQSLHNHRLSCVNGMLLRNGRHCEECIGHTPWRGVVHRCQHGSLLQSAAVARMIVSNRRRGTWDSEVDAFITPSAYARSKALAAGIPAARTFVKPNTAPDPGEALPPPSTSMTAVFAGRLSPEKGLETLLEAWVMAASDPARRLTIVGDGPARSALESRAGALGLTRQVVFTGWIEPDRVKAALCEARFFVLPSLCGETFGTSVVEALSCGRPAIVTACGGQGEIVNEGETGFKVPPGDRAALARAIDAAYSDSELLNGMGRHARTEFLARYTPERSFEKLMRIYEFAMSRRGALPASAAILAGEAVR